MLDAYTVHVHHLGACSVNGKYVSPFGRRPVNHEEMHWNAEAGDRLVVGERPASVVRVVTQDGVGSWCWYAGAF